MNQRGNHAGTKARNDAEVILKRFGAHPINKKQFILQSREDDSIYSNIKNRLDLIPYFANAKFLKNEKVFIQYPMLAFDWTDQYFDALAKKNRIILLIHDLHSLRRGDEEACREELRIINKADTVIVHNRFMKEKMLSLGLTVQNIFCLDIFDYLCDEATPKGDEDAVVFAGNLNKSDFLYRMFGANKDVRFNIYGNPDDRLNSYENVHYHGSFLPDELPSVLNGKYGLVWDGGDIDGCSGVLGEYTRINNPHKLSLYVASGLPVIVWNEAAIAEYVDNNGIGIITDSISNLEELIHVPDEQYTQMQENVLRLRKNIINGSHLTHILEEIERGNYETAR
ncbi:MAG: hypothetical protein IKE36_08415 [Solobacterium sp.]|nr:hypothetical protein [Solobacterium sp.]